MLVLISSFGDGRLACAGTFCDSCTSTGRVVCCTGGGSLTSGIQIGGVTTASVRGAGETTPADGGDIADTLGHSAGKGVIVRTGSDSKGVGVV